MASMEAIRSTMGFPALVTEPSVGTTAAAASPSCPDQTPSSGGVVQQIPDGVASSSGRDGSNKNPVHFRTRIHNDRSDEWMDDPDQVDELLTKELMELTMENRNGIQDEIHGVHCVAPEETPELLRSSLAQITHHLEHVIPVDQKMAYIESTKHRNTSYVHTNDDFKLRFLRMEFFDVPKAAIRMAVYLDLLKDLYGSYALLRPVRLSDFSKKELADFRKGRVQLLSSRDRGGAGSGRRIVCIFPDKEWESIPARTRHKFSLYLFWIAGNDVDVQRKGIVFLVWLDSKLEPSYKPLHRTKTHQIPCVRISSLHICSPDTPFYRFRRALIIMASGEFRSRMKVHLGESMEVRYILQGFGFPSDKIPITYSGSIKNANLKKWMKLRHLHEDGYLTRVNKSSSPRGGTSSNNNSNSSSPPAIIDCPYLTDVLFRRGQSMMSHPGNVTLRRLIKSKLESGDFDKQEKHKTRTFIQKIIDEIKTTNLGVNNPPVRLLDWDEKTGCSWKEIDDDEALYNKIRKTVKELQNAMAEEQTRIRKCQARIDQRGGTSIFQSQDGSRAVPATPFGLVGSSSGGAAATSAFKKPRLDDEGGGEPTTISDTEADMAEILHAPEANCVSECFGMRFTPCGFGASGSVGLAYPSVAQHHQASPKLQQAASPKLRGHLQ